MCLLQLYFYFLKTLKKHLTDVDFSRFQSDPSSQSLMSEDDYSDTVSIKEEDTSSTSARYGSRQCSQTLGHTGHILLDTSFVATSYRTSPVDESLSLFHRTRHLVHPSVMMTPLGILLGCTLHCDECLFQTFFSLEGVDSI